MIVNLLGYLIIICGSLGSYLFLLPDGRPLPSMLFFYIGFFLLFKPNKYLKISSSLSKYARIGLLANIVGLLFSFLLGILVVKTALSSIKFGHLLFIGAYWIFTPMTQISEVLFPSDWIEISDAGAVGTISYFRITLTGFLDISFYIIIAVIIGKWISRKQKRVQEI